MSQIHTVGLDLAKQVFQVHAITVDGGVVLKRQLRRSQVLTFFSKLSPCLVGMEACGGAHFWAREIASFGHQVRLMPPAYVKPYVKRGKTDAGDAEAIGEAVSRPTMRFVPVKTSEQQAAAMLLKTRDLLVRQRNQAINALRAHLSELGIIAGTGVSRVAGLIAVVRDESDPRLPEAARRALAELSDQIEALNERLHRLEREIVVQARQDPDLRRLTTVPGIGPISAASLKALVPDPNGFVSGRHFAAWLGLTPQSHSSGGKERLADLEDGQSDVANPADPWGHHRPAPCAQRGQSLTLGDVDSGTQASQGRRRRAGQQDGAHRPGASREGRRLPQTRSLWGKRCERVIRADRSELTGEPPPAGQACKHTQGNPRSAPS